MNCSQKIRVSDLPTVSTMTGKLQEIAGVSTSPLDNPFCLAMAEKDTICAFCYSQAMLKGRRKNCRPSWDRNGKIFSAPMSEEIVRAYAERIKSPSGLVRFHPHGELINRQHTKNFYRIAAARPELTFALWTKRKNLVKGLEKPKNLILIYSNPAAPEKNKVIENPPSGFDKVFNVVSKEYSGAINCGSKKCAECKLCYSSKTVNSIIEEVK